MGIFGTIMKYVMIILVSLFAVVVLLCLALYIFPGFKIFGYHVINSNGYIKSAEYLFNDYEYADTDNEKWTEADAVRIETVGFDVTIRTINTQKELYGGGSVVAYMEGSYTGFMRGDVENITYDSSAKSGNYITEGGKNIFYVTIAEPEVGFLMRTVNKLTIIVPQNAFQTKPLEIITKSGTINFGGDKDTSSKTINTTNLSLKSTSGKINLNNLNCSSTIDITTDKGEITAAENLDLLCDVNITAKLNYINIPKFGKEGYTSNMLSVTSSDGHIVLGDVYGALKVSIEQGELDINNVFEYADLNVARTLTRLKNFKSGLQLRGTSASVTCDLVEGNLIATMGDGSCVFAKTKGTVDWESQNGSITLKSPESNLKLKTKTGNITINCNDNPIEIQISSLGGYINFSNLSGNILINDSLDETASSCNIKGTFAPSVQNKLNVFNTTTGTTNLTIPQTTLLLKWATMGGSVNIDFVTWSSLAKTTKAYTGSTLEWVEVWEGHAHDIDTTIPRISINNTNGRIIVNKLI